MKPEPWEWAVFDSLSKGRTLPGPARDRPDRVPEASRHRARPDLSAARRGRSPWPRWAAARPPSASRSPNICAWRWAAAAAAAPIPAMVVGPGIVTGKENWPKEIPEVVPGATSRVVTLGARPLPKPARITAWLRARGIALDEQSLEGLRCCAMSGGDRTGRRRTRTCRSATRCSDALRAALSRRATSHPPARRKGARAPNLLDAPDRRIRLARPGGPARRSERPRVGRRVQPGAVRCRVQCWPTAGSHFRRPVLRDRQARSGSGARHGHSPDESAAAG